MRGSWLHSEWCDGVLNELSTATRVKFFEFLSPKWTGGNYCNNLPQVCETAILCMSFCTRIALVFVALFMRYTSAIVTFHIISYHRTISLPLPLMRHPHMLGFCRTTVPDSMNVAKRTGHTWMMFPLLDTRSMPNRRTKAAYEGY